MNSKHSNTVPCTLNEMSSAIIDYAANELAKDDECTIFLSANSRSTAFNYMSYHKKDYALDAWVGYVESDDQSTSNLACELLSTMGHAMEKEFTLKALEVAFPIAATVAA